MKTFQLLLMYCILSFFPTFHAKVINRISYCEVGPCYTINLPCDNKGKVKRCFKNAKLLKEQDFRYQLQDTINKLRNNVAGGEVYNNLPTAARMGKMIWDTELAYFAQLDVSRCEVIPRPCMSSPKFNLLGSLAGMQGYIPNNSTSSLDKTIQDIAHNWFKDIRSITRLDTLNLAVTAKESGTLSAALLLIENNTKFGCAILRYYNNLNYYHYIILSCVFSMNNQEGQRIYNWGVSPGVNCRTRDSKYLNLCASGETYGTKKPQMHYIRL